MKKKDRVYAIYKGDEFQDVGTLKELSSKLHLKENTILFYSSPANKKRSRGNRLEVFLVGSIYDNLEEKNE